MDTERIKYNRTPHLHESPGATNDDKWLSEDGLTNLKSGIDLVTTEKLDGGNLTFTHNHFFARSIDSTSNQWDRMAKALWAGLRMDIPLGWRVSGESLYARRSIAYENLPGIYVVFGIWDETNTLLDWDSTAEWANLLSLPLAPVLYRGSNFTDATQAWAKTHSEEHSEGFVVRSSSRIPHSQFALNVAKYVRAKHVRTEDRFRRRDDFPLNTFLKA